jgi:hypothetical protein
MHNGPAWCQQTAHADEYDRFNLCTESLHGDVYISAVYLEIPGGCASHDGENGEYGPDFKSATGCVGPLSRGNTLYRICSSVGGLTLDAQGDQQQNNNSRN